MTDKITCPECDGRGETTIGRLRLACQFCQCRGWVGGEHEPAEGPHQRADGYRMPDDFEEYDPDVHGPLPPVWEHPATEALGACPACLGAGTVIGLGDIYRETTGQLTEQPCPRCRGHPLDR